MFSCVKIVMDSFFCKIYEFLRFKEKNKLSTCLTKLIRTKYLATHISIANLPVLM